MRDKKDNATFDLPGFEPATAPATALGPNGQPNGAPVEKPKRNGTRPRRVALKQEQMLLLEETDTTGLPVWRRDDKLDLTGLPVWAPDPSDHP